MLRSHGSCPACPCSPCGWLRSLQQHVAKGCLGCIRRRIMWQDTEEEDAWPYLSKQVASRKKTGILRSVWPSPEGHIQCFSNSSSSYTPACIVYLVHLPIFILYTHVGARTTLPSPESNPLKAARRKKHRHTNLCLQRGRSVAVGALGTTQRITHGVEMTHSSKDGLKSMETKF